MASIVVSGDTSGAVTLSAPSVAGTTTVTLPSSTGTMALLQTPSFATTIGVGGTTASASGAGVSFPATQSASSDANTLDDYEEGTWTATMSTSSSGSVTISTNTGWYTKIGRQVSVLGQFKVGSVSSPAGELYINGLPFTSLSGSTNHSGIAIFADGLTASATTQMMGYISPNGTTIAIGRFSAGAYLGQGANVCQANSYFFIQATYFTT